MSDATLTPVPITGFLRTKPATGGVGFGTGSGFPGPQVPYGQVRPGPDTADADGQADADQRGSKSCGAAEPAEEDTARCERDVTLVEHDAPALVMLPGLAERGEN